MSQGSVDERKNQFEKLVVPVNYDILIFDSLAGQKLFAIYHKQKSTMRSIVNALKTNYSLTSYGTTKESDFYLNVPDLNKYLSSVDYNKTPTQLGINSKTGIHISYDRYVNYGLLMENSIIADKIKARIKKSTDHITIKSLNGKEVHLQIDPSITVLELKFLFEQVTKISIDQQRMIYLSKNLEDDKILDFYKITNGSILHVVFRLRGGMYHETSGKSGNYQPLQDCVFFVPIDDDDDEVST